MVLIPFQSLTFVVARNVNAKKLFIANIPSLTYSRKLVRKFAIRKWEFCISLTTRKQNKRQNETAIYAWQINLLKKNNKIIKIKIKAFIR